MGVTDVLHLSYFTLNTVMIPDHKWLVFRHVKARTARVYRQYCPDMFRTAGYSGALHWRSLICEDGIQWLCAKRASFGVVRGKY